MDRRTSATPSSPWESTMRWAFEAALLALACACGNLSNQDVAFIEAIPQKQDLHVSFPRPPAAQSACAIGPADVFTSARTTGDSINSGVDAILALVDAILGQTPTRRDADSRIWGPYPDRDHPGVQARATLYRELDQHGVPWRWVYAIEEARPPGAFLPILEGELFGPQARTGVGRLTLHFENAVTLGVAKPTDPTLPIRIYYDLGGDPHTVSLDLTAASGFGLIRFDYAFAGYADGHGRFDYAVPDPKSGCTIEITTWFNAQGAGRDVFRALCGNTVLGDVQQCWDVSACLTYVNDPFAFTASCNGLQPCLLGNASLCPAGL